MEKWTKAESFKEKKDAQKFKEHVEKKEKRLKQAVIVEVPYLDEAVQEWKEFLNRYTPTTKKLYEYRMGCFVNYAGDSVSLISDLTARVLKLLNNRPRKCLNYRTPTEVFWSKPMRCASD